jgi:hypothetical protein
MTNSCNAKTFFDTPPAPLSNTHALATEGSAAQKSHDLPSVCGQAGKGEGIEGCVLTQLNIPLMNSL